MTVARGERAGSAKLTREDVTEIRRRVAEGRATQAQLAREFGVSQPTISSICIGRTWRHLRGSETVTEPARPPVPWWQTPAYWTPRPLRSGEVKAPAAIMWWLWEHGFPPGQMLPSPWPYRTFDPGEVP